MKTVFLRLALAGLVAGQCQWAFGQEGTDLASMSFEELQQLRVVSTPKFAARADDIPSAVSIIGADDIRTFGWRTLADVLRSLQGFNVTDDHTYAYAGVRGVSMPGDFRSRLQVLIDGIPVNENIYASANIDSGFPLDLDLVHHIEVVRGPSASVYGGDSMFGVVNVITRTGRGLAGGEVALSGASGRANQARVSWGHADGAGTDVLLSLTGFEADGRRLRFPEMAALGMDATASRTDGEEGGKLYARLIRGDWRATLLHSKRKRIVTNGSYGTLFDDPAHDEADDYTLAELANDNQLDRHNSLHTRIYSGSYTYRGNFPYDYPPHGINRDLAEGRWWGLESRLLSTAREGHRWTAGFEYKRNFRQNQWNGDLGVGCFSIGTEACLDSRRSSEVYSVYAQDEIALTQATLLTLGLRHDRAGDQPSHWSPRVGLVHHNEGANTFKLLYATAFRDPAVYERYYTLPGYAYGSAELQPEKMRSLEAVWERRLGPGTRLTATAYQFRLEGLIAPDGGGMAWSSQDRVSRGAEIEFERRWPDLATLRTGYSRQLPGGNAGRMDNAPQHMFKLNLGLPLGHESWMAGFEAQAVSHRLSAGGATRVGGYGVANLSISHRPRGAAWDAAFGIYNLFDRQYADPVALDEAMPVLRDRIAQNGRSYRLKLTVRF